MPNFIANLFQEAWHHTEQFIIEAKDAAEAKVIAEKIGAEKGLENKFKFEIKKHEPELETEAEKLVGNVARAGQEDAPEPDPR